MIPLYAIYGVCTQVDGAIIEVRSPEGEGTGEGEYGGEEVEGKGNTHTFTYKHKLHFVANIIGSNSSKRTKFDPGLNTNSVVLYIDRYY